MSEKELIQEHIISIKENSKSIRKDIKIMEICGGHTNVIMKYGIRELLPKNIKLISGPGCPVCVSSQYDIDCMIELAKQGSAIATYGDMMKVPGSRYNLEEIKAQTGKVFEIYSTAEVIGLQEKYPDIVFFGIGFETTAPMTAYLLENDICVYSVHKIVPPAMKLLTEIDGFIDPGHVSAIIGLEEYEKIKVPQVIAGFTPERILRGLSILTQLIKDKKSIVINAYPEVVSSNGNKKAKELLEKHFRIADSEWRGLGILPMSGLEVKDDNLNAKIKYKGILEKVPIPKPTGCRCGDVLKGEIEPDQCPLYQNVCTPNDPKGACMVSSEGSCAIYYKNLNKG